EEFAKAYAIPGVGPFLRRFVRVSKKGEEDKLRRELEPVAQGEAQKSLAIRNHMIAFLNKMPAGADAAALREGGKGAYRQALAKGVTTVDDGYAFSDFRTRFEKLAIARYGSKFEKA